MKWHCSLADLPSLLYTRMMVKETLRWSPGAPLDFDVQNEAVNAEYFRGRVQLLLLARLDPYLFHPEVYEEKDGERARVRPS